MQIKQNIKLVILFLIILPNQLFAENNRPDDHAPIGVMRDHVHNKGEVMASYRFSYMKMKGLRNGDDKINTGSALNSYMMAPRSMTMKMHMIGAMYGITDQLTISAMGNFVEKDSDGEHRMSGKFKRHSGAIGDTKINGSYQFYNQNGNRLQFNLALSLPTGNINQKYQNSRLGYSMQIGSGSYELLPGVSYSGKKDTYSYGTQINSTFRLDANDNGYKLGDTYNLTTWVAKKINENFSLSSRLDYNKYEAIEGSDLTLNSMMPANDSSLYDKERLDLLLGTNFIVQNGYFEGNRLAIEFGIPIYQRIDGPMLESDYKVIIGWQKVF